MRRHRPICGGRESLELGCQQSRIGRGCREIHVSWQEKGRFTADVRRLANLTILFIDIQVHTVEIERTHFILSATIQRSKDVFHAMGVLRLGSHDGAQINPFNLTAFGLTAVQGFILGLLRGILLPTLERDH